MDINSFHEPPVRFRPALFWGINDRLNRKKTARQFRDFRRVGLSGAFFHGRAGLVSEYLGSDWFESVEAALEAARETDGLLWLYDEDLYPSGNAGGMVAALGEDYRQAWLEPRLFGSGREIPKPDSSADAPKPMACYKIISRKNILLEHCERAENPDASTERLVFYRHLAPKTGWWSGESYCNLLNPEVTRAFIRMTHEKYRQKFVTEFGKHIPGIFTDEPQLASDPHVVPWWSGLPDVYKTWTGRDWWADLPYLYFDGPQARKIRLLIHRTLLRQFIEAFTRPIFNWCERNHLQFTGHYNAEETLAGQIAHNGGSVMAHYPHMHIPGIDALMRQVDGHLLTYKQVASAARQAGKPLALNEIFGVSHHSNSFEDFRWLADASMVAGVTFLVPHLGWYSMKGKRKRDYPPNWNYQQTYWDQLKPLNDYLARTAAILSAGTVDCGILVLHPAEAATADYRRELPEAPPDLTRPGQSAIGRMEEILKTCLTTIMEDGWDVDLGEESYLESAGSVEDRKFVVGKMKYHTVVAPESKTWRPRTLELLKTFASNGGRILFVGALPEEIDGEPSASWLELSVLPSVSIIAADPRAIRNSIQDAPASFRITDFEGGPVPGLRVQHRSDGNQDIFFVVNTDRNTGRQIRLTLFNKAGTRISSLNAVDGSRLPVKARRTGSDLESLLSVEPMGSLLLLAEPQAPERSEPPFDFERARTMPIARQWSFSRAQENVLVLDRLSYSLDEGRTFRGPMPEYAARHEIAEHFGLRDALEWQPWAATRKKTFTDRGGKLVLRYEFRSSLPQVPKASVVIENLMTGSLLVNGTKVHLEKAGWQWDTGFGKISIAELIKLGVNVIDFGLQYDYLSEIEAAYLIGDFGVRFPNPFEPELCAEPAILFNGSWTRQGYPFYAGSMIYRTQLKLDKRQIAQERIFLQLWNPAGILFRVHLNGEPAGDLLWRPWRIDIGRLAKPGKNELEIEVVSSMQNSHGPLHLKDGDARTWQGPESFEDSALLMPAYSLADTGLLDGAVLLIG